MAVPWVSDIIRPSGDLWPNLRGSHHRGGFEQTMKSESAGRSLSVGLIFEPQEMGNKTVWKGSTVIALSKAL